MYICSATVTNRIGSANNTINKGLWENVVPIIVINSIAVADGNSSFANRNCSLSTCTSHDITVPVSAIVDEVTQSSPQKMKEIRVRPVSYNQRLTVSNNEE